MKLNKEFISHHTGKESILVPTGAANFFGLVKGNATFGAVVELLEKGCSETEIVKTLCERFDGPKDKIAADVSRAIAELKKIGAVED